MLGAEGSEETSCSDELTAFLQNIFDVMAKKYTMNDEREVHNLALPGFIEKIEAAKMEMAAPVYDDDDDGLF